MLDKKCWGGSTVWEWDVKKEAMRRGKMKTVHVVFKATVRYTAFL